jgi:hypothetical protein
MHSISFQINSATLQGENKWWESRGIGRKGEYKLVALLLLMMMIYWSFLMLSYV